MTDKLGILLLQMGGPLCLEEVEDYIHKLFADPNLVQLPLPLRLFQGRLAKFVAKRRAPQVREQYRLIGGFSPNNAITQRQAAALQQKLADPSRYLCFAAMGYTQPTVAEAVEQAKESGCHRLLALSLFPQYCRASTGASLADLAACCPDFGYSYPDVLQIDRWGGADGYIQALQSRVENSLAKAVNAYPHSRPHLVVSAHGIPESYVRRGDPYVSEVRESLKLLRAMLPPEQEITLSFQSRATPTKWVAPATDQTLEKLGKEGKKSLVVLPISFVNDHIETLYEIDMELREIALENGVEYFDRVPAFNSDFDFIEFLATLVLNRIDSGAMSIDFLASA